MDNSGPAVLRSNLSPGSAKWAAPWGLGGYRHKRLDTSALTIRLLKLHRSHSNNIEGYLRQFTLDDAPEYTALSYTWGKKTDQKQICIEGRNFEVWPNLYNFLELFMSRGSDEWLWVDQVCIDQTSTAERNHQVTIMKRIYQRANKVVMWLNEYEPQSGIAERPCDEVCQRSNHRWKDSPLGLHSDKFATWLELNRDYRPGDGNDSVTIKDYLRFKEQKKIGEPGSELPERPCEWLRALFEHPYWQRLWIIQEVFFAKDPVIWFGSSIVQWPSINKYPLTLNQRDNVVWLLSLPARIERKHLLLADVIKLFKSSVCADKYDKLFGVQGLVRESHRIAVNYELEPEQLFVNAAMILLTHEILHPSAEEALLHLVDILNPGDWPREEVSSDLKRILKIAKWYRRTGPGLSQRKLRRALECLLAGRMSVFYGWMKDMHAEIESSLEGDRTRMRKEVA